MSRVIVFGSLNMDVVLKTDNLPCLGETRLCSQDAFFSPGGKGLNQAVAAARAGADVQFFGSLGSDAFGDTLLQTLIQEQIGSSHIHRSLKSTGCASVWVNHAGDNTILVATGANADARSQEIPDTFLQPENVLVLQMETPEEENWGLIQRAFSHGTQTILNLAPVQPIPSKILSCLSGLILNEGEAQKLALFMDLPYDTPETFARLLAKRYDLWVVVTRGPQDVLMCTPENSWSASVLALTPLDTTAAGDTFAGTFAAAFAQKNPLIECLHQAVAAGGLACLHAGAVPSIPWKKDIVRAKQSLPFPQIV